MSMRMPRHAMPPAPVNLLERGVAAQAEGLDVTWTQSTDEVYVKVPVDSSVRGKDVKFEVHPTRLALSVGGSDVLAGGLTDAGQVDVDGAFRASSSFKDCIFILFHATHPVQRPLSSAASAVCNMPARQLPPHQLRTPCTLPPSSRNGPLNPAAPAPHTPAHPTGCFWVMESEDDQKYVLVTLAKKTMGYESWEQLLSSDAVDTSITDRVRGWALCLRRGSTL